MLCADVASGPRRVSDITIYRPTAITKAVIKTFLPETVTPFQAAWLRLLSARTEIKDREAFLEHSRSFLEGWPTTEIGRTAIAVDESNRALESQRSAIALAEAATLKEFDATPEVQELSTQITDLNAVLEGIKGAIAVVLDALKAPGLEAKDRDELEGVQREGEEQAGELTAVLTGCRDSLANFKAILMKPVEEMRTALAIADATSPARRLWLHERDSIEYHARIEREVREAEERLAVLRKELPLVMQEVSGFSPAAAMVVLGEYKGSALEDLKTLREASRLLREEIGPLLAESMFYGRDPAAIALADLKRQLHEARWDEEELAKKALPKIDDPVEECEQKIVFLGKQIAIWQVFCQETGYDMSSFHLECLKKELASKKEDLTRRAFFSVKDLEGTASKGLSFLNPECPEFRTGLSDLLFFAKKNPEWLVKLPLAELQIACEKVQAFLGEWEKMRARIGDPEFGKEEIKGYTKALSELQKAIDLKSGKTGDLVAFHKAQEAEDLARHPVMEAYLNLAKDWVSYIPSPAYSVAKQSKREAAAEALPWLKERIAFWEGLLWENPGLADKINSHLTELRALETTAKQQA
ncbi:MAG: hypothetical protein NT099_02590 [Candidatus Saganbacteria bacterium]|nr:hypothetical protein [Candidatus Saganbacteria bacterium]